MPPLSLLGTALVVLALVIQSGADAAGGPTPGVGIIRWGSSYPAAAGYDRYAYVSVGTADAASAGALPTRSLVYMSGTSVQASWSTGVSYQEALANNWLLKAANGAYVMNVQYGAYVGDIGNVAYQQRFVDNVAALLTTNGNEGVFIDDVLATPVVLTSGVYPAKYPTQQAWEDATVSFIAKVGQDLRARGFYVLAHANGWIPGDANSDNGVNNARFWGRLAPHVSGLESEYWVQDPNNVTRLRASGSEWYQQWDGWANFANVAQGAGVDFFALMYGSTSSIEIMRYGKASFLLFWDGSGGAFVYEASGDPWNPEWTMDIGLPSGSRYQVGTGWRRDYSGGTVVLNSSPSSSQTFSLGGTYTRADGTAVTSVTLAPTTALVLKSSSTPPPPPPPAAPVNTTLPAISGAAQEGMTLSASNGSWSNSPTGYAYQWRRCDAAGAACVAIAGATATQYGLVAADVGKTLRAVVTASNTGGSASATSNATPMVAPVPAPPPPPPANLAPPVISGVSEEKETLTASNGSWSNSPTGYAYQWRRCDSAGGSCTSVTGATSAGYALVSADVGKTLRAVVTASNAEGVGSATSAPSSVVGPAPGTPPLPVNLTPPNVFGPQVVGKIVRSSDGSWTNNPNRFTYQWRRCQAESSNCNDIDGETGSRYTAVPDDIGSWLAVRVTAWNHVGSGSASSVERHTALIRAGSVSFW